MDKVIRFSCVVVLLVVTSAGVYAQTAAAPVPSAAAPVDESTLALAETPRPGTGATGSSSILPYFLRMVLVLGLVIAAIYGLYVLLKRSAKPAVAPDSYLRVLASTNLAVGRSLHVVSLGARAWLVGATDASIGLIAELDDKELIDALALRAAEAPQTPRRDFASILGSLLNRKGGSRTTRASDASDFFDRQKDRLRKF